MSFRSLKLELMSYVPELNAVQAGLRLNRAYQHLLDAHPWSFIKGEAIITTVAPYNTGTVNLTQGSATVTGVGTAWATATHTGRWFQRSSEGQMYKISSVNDIAQTMVLESVWGYSDVVGGTYNIIQHRFSKPTDCKDILGIRLRTNLARVPKTFLDTLDPTRVSTGEPIYWIDIEDDVVELWPVPEQVYQLRVWYNKVISDMSAETDTSLIPERLVLSFARLHAYQQLGGTEQGARYINLIPIAQQEFSQLWMSAWEVDVKKLSLPNRVLVDGLDFPYSNEYWYSHDPLDPRG